MLICLLWYRVCTYVSLDISEKILCVYVFVVVEGMFACKTGVFGKEPYCLYLVFGI